MQSYGDDFSVAIEKSFRDDECALYTTSKEVSLTRRIEVHAKRELVERISGSSEISGVRLQDWRVGINSSKSWISFDSFLSLSIFPCRTLLFVRALYLFSTERFCSFFDGPVAIPTIDVFLVRADALQILPLLLFLLSVSVSVSGEDVSAASFRSQKQPDHHPRDHSSHLWNDRNEVTRYLHK